MPFYLVEGDITKYPADAIVNAANTQLMPGGGVCGAIFKAAGFRRLSTACQAIGHCEAGSAVITPGFDLPAKYIIHTPGPIWLDGTHNEESILRSCYRSCLQLAAENDCQSIAFPLISSGIYGYPYDEALRVARETIIQFLKTMQDELNVFMVLLQHPHHYEFRGKAGLARQLSRMERHLQEYILENQRGNNLYQDDGDWDDDDWDDDDWDDAIQEGPEDPVCCKCVDACPQICTLEDMLETQAKTFSEMLLSLIESREAKPSEIYKKANIDRKLFYKIKQDKDYHPSKMTVLAFSAALELDIDEASDLLNTAGFAFSKSSRADIIVRYYFERNIYDIYTINDALFYYGEPLLGNAIG